MANPIQTVEDIFTRAIALQDSAERDRFVHEACHDKPTLLEEILELLSAHETVPAFLDETPRISSARSGPPSIPGFRIERKLGEGGLGAVYLAWDETLQRTVAIKVLTGAARKNRILEEARNAAALNDPAIVTVHSVLPEAIVMEVVEGFPVDRATEVLNFRQKAEILREIARALAVAHRQGIVHRDLKPENVLVTPRLQPKILDFGLAVSAGDAKARGVFEGTPRYASPEQVRGETLSPPSDIFSFGSLMFKVLTGRPAFEGEDVAAVLHAITHSLPPFPRDLALGVPEDLQAICLACLASEPSERPSASEIALDLGRFLAGEPVRARPALYGDILRKRISDYSRQLDHWQAQGMVSVDERDRLLTVHRRILADEDHWIVDARKISFNQAALYTATWLVVVGSGLFVWLASDEVAAPWNWLAPVLASVWLGVAGWISARKNETLASASFLAAAVLSLLPSALAALRTFGFLAAGSAQVQQLFEGTFSNQQLLAASGVALGCSAMAWRKLRLTGFAWTTAFLLAASFFSALLYLNWLSRPWEVRALWCLPLVGLAAVALRAERLNRVRWALPFYLIAGVTLVGALDVMALYGPTFDMIGFGSEGKSFWSRERREGYSLALNGLLFLTVALRMEDAWSLDMRRASRWLEPMGIAHILGALYLNAQGHRDDPNVSIDAIFYIGAVLLVLVLGAWRSRWRTLLMGLAGVALGAHLLMDLKVVAEPWFTLALMIAGLLLSALIYARLQAVANRSS